MTPSIQEVEAAVIQFTPAQLAEFRAWFAEFDAQNSPEQDAQEITNWDRFAAQNLARAYGSEEPDYTAADLKQLNPDYAGR